MEIRTRDDVARTPVRPIGSVVPMVLRLIDVINVGRYH